MVDRKRNRRETAAILRKIPFNNLLGMRIAGLHHDGVTLACKIEPRLFNFKGILYDGVSAALADAAAGVALHRHFAGQRAITTVELKINYFRPVAKGRVFARSRLLRTGSTICVSRVDIADARGRALGTALVIYMVLHDQGQRET